MPTPIARWRRAQWTGTCISRVMLPDALVSAPSGALPVIRTSVTIAAAHFRTINTFPNAEEGDGKALEKGVVTSVNAQG